jgi:hypothetical protein
MSLNIRLEEMDNIAIILNNHDIYDQRLCYSEPEKIIMMARYLKHSKFNYVKNSYELAVVEIKEYLDNAYTKYDVSYGVKDSAVDGEEYYVYTLTIKEVT